MRCKIKLLAESDIDGVVVFGYVPSDSMTVIVMITMLVILIMQNVSPSRILYKSMILLKLLMIIRLLMSMIIMMVMVCCDGNHNDNQDNDSDTVNGHDQVHDRDLTRL